MRLTVYIPSCTCGYAPVCTRSIVRHEADGNHMPSLGPPGRVTCDAMPTGAALRYQPVPRENPRGGPLSRLLDGVSGASDKTDLALTSGMASSSYKWRCLSCDLLSPEVVLTPGQQPPVDAATVYCNFCNRQTTQRPYGAPERRATARQPEHRRRPT